MNDCQREKQRFVAEHLEPTIVAASEGDVASVEYAVEGGEEFVHIVYRNGYRRRRCVTGDSLKSLSMDVLTVV